jgi:hypothetical protein
MTSLFRIWRLVQEWPKMTFLRSVPEKWGGHYAGRKGQAQTSRCPPASCTLSARGVLDFSIICSRKIVAVVFCYINSNVNSLNDFLYVEFYDMQFKIDDWFPRVIAKLYCMRDRSWHLFMNLHVWIYILEIGELSHENLASFHMVRQPHFGPQQQKRKNAITKHLSSCHYNHVAWLKKKT